MTRDELKEYIAGHFEGRLKPLESGRYALLYEVSAADLTEIAQALRDDSKLNLNFLCNIAAIDVSDHFEVVYSVASLTENHRLDFKVILPHDNPEIESIQEIWPAANWYEREMWELYGINILKHDNLTRFLLPDDWNQGHPMRKDWDAPDFIRFPELER